jgi:hypothetical protein
VCEYGEDEVCVHEKVARVIQVRSFRLTSLPVLHTGAFSPVQHHYHSHRHFAERYSAVPSRPGRRGNCCPVKRLEIHASTGDCALPIGGLCALAAKSIGKTIAPISILHSTLFHANGDQTKHRSSLIAKQCRYRPSHAPQIPSMFDNRSCHQLPLHGTTIAQYTWWMIRGPPMRVVRR